MPLSIQIFEKYSPVFYLGRSKGWPLNMGRTARKVKVSSPVEAYLDNLQSRFRYEASREHTYRPALQEFIESFGKGIDALNDPARVTCGAPDFIVHLSKVPVGYVEAKDIGKNLDKEEKSDQMKGYHSLGNVILTNYLEFRWYVDGERRSTAILGKVSGRKIVEVDGGYAQVESLFDNFLASTGKTITNAMELAGRLAEVTKSIKVLIVRSFDMEDDDGWLHRWLKAFSEVLIDNLDQEMFADMFAQTLAYGFFAARVHHSSKAKFSRFSAARILPKTNPFLRKLFAQFSGVDMPDTIDWAVDEIIDILNRADMDKVLRGFGNNSGKEDPVVHFYETFLAAYNPSLREHRGVYYTPTPVTDFIVRSVDKILIDKFSVKRGLADDDTLILDPAVGTGSFLYKVIEKIYQRFSRNRGAWNSYVSSNLLNRIFGFEILMAPYSVAHLKLGHQLQDTGYKFERSKRLGVYLTDTLEAAAKKSQELLFEWISEEANAASDIKKDRPIMVVLGNPPYKGNSANKGEWIKGLLNGFDGITNSETDSYFECDGAPLNERNPKWLNDDYVKFIRFSQWRIKQTGHGVIGFITNHGYLDNPTFRGMRQSLINSFDEIYILDLHGSTKRGEVCPSGGRDENVFDIQQGVSICFMVRLPGDHVRSADIRRFDIYGARQEKYKFLLSEDYRSIRWRKVCVERPQYSFTVARNKKLKAEYGQHWGLAAIFPVNTVGFQTHRDSLAISSARNEMESRIAELRDKGVPDGELRRRYSLKDTGSWSLRSCRDRLADTRRWKKYIVQCSYRPFDNRYCYFNTAVTDRPRKELLEHVVNRENVCLLSSRQQGVEGYAHAWVTTEVANDCVVSTKSKEANQVFPLFLYYDPILDVSGKGEPDKVPNISAPLIEALQDAWGVKLSKNRHKGAFTAYDIFYFVYAILNSPYYRDRYKSLLKTDFPRIPFPCDKRVFDSILELGKRLVELHSLKAKAVRGKGVRFPKEGSNEVDRVYYDEELGRIYINETQYFSGISRDVWRFRVGSYDVAEKWLKDRRGVRLEYADIDMYKKIVKSCTETLCVTARIDKVLRGGAQGYSFRLVEFKS